jgi:hypothetical protein
MASHLCHIFLLLLSSLLLLVCGIHTTVLLASHLCPTFLPLVAFLLLLVSLRIAGVPDINGSLLMRASLLLLVSQLWFCVSPVAGFTAVTNDQLLRCPSWAGISAIAGVHVVAGVTAAAGTLTVACAATALVFCCRWLSIRC